MEMFLMALAMSLLGVAVTAALFVAATRTDTPAAPGAARRADVGQRRFFAGAPVPDAPAEVVRTAEAVPVEALLLRIEQHIRLEEAAAEAFLRAPDQAALHSRTTSRLVN
jgi:hypothetical protein